MRLHLFVAAAALSFTGCSFNALGIGAESSGAASTSLDETSTTSPTSTTAPTTSDTTGDPADCGNSIKDAGEECDNGELNNGLNGSICKGDCTKNICGDGYLASNEGCDDGNTVDDDECSNACKAAGCGDGVVKPPEECDSTPECSDLCKNPFCGDGVVNGDEACDDGVDNGDNKACTVDCAVATCGDGKIQDGVEACDDGNQVDDDECSNTCTLATCGDSKPQPGEDCDDGNKDDTDACSSLCKNATCGDGFLWTGMEECDAGPDNSDTNVCTTSCKDAKCGDKLVLAGTEQCDDGDMDDTDACIDCKSAKCGDGFVQDGVEDCDDGNMVAGDGCTNCANDCGNGKIEMNEECDDGNASNGDTCNDVCARTAYMVFITSTKWKGDLGGLTGADAKCNALAAGKVPGTYKAWLSGESESADMRLFHSTKPYIRPDKMTIAANWADLTSKDLQQTINRNESNQAVVGNACGSEAQVWTNTLQNAMSKNGDHCTNWTDGGMGKMGNSGVATVKTASWTDACVTKCDGMGRLYCVEQPAP